MSKGLAIRSIGTVAAYEIFLEGGGRVPTPLSGQFTSETAAKNAIKSFQASVRNRVTKRGKTKG